VPVLAAETQCYPADLFCQECHSDEQWWVLHTKPRCEKSLARILKREGISFFLPQGRTKRKHQRRWVTTHLPLFPGYLFLRGTDDSRTAAIQTNKVVATLEVDNQGQLHRELTALHQVVNSSEEVAPAPSIEPGCPVEVVRGALTGLRGVVSRCDGVARIILEVKMLNRGVSVQVEEWMLQKI
jgi:transcriptional antiterminator RfaH